MELWTVQLSQWRRLAATDIVLYNTTVKNGDPLFAPTWSAVMGIKEGTLTEQQYTALYHERMRESYKANKQHWLQLCDTPRLAIACFCKAGCFCHRHLLVTYLQKVCEHHNKPCKLMGEFNI